MERNLAYVALFAALIAVLAVLPAVTLPSGVPITAQTLGIMLCGTVLGARLGGLAALLYAGLGVIGLPILSGGAGGFGVLAGPSAGFIIGFPISAFVTGLVFQTWRANIAISAFVASVIGAIIAQYSMGIIGLSINAGLSIKQAAIAMTPFIPGDLLKAALAGLITRSLARARPQALLSRN
jgi:biotin transport system substrate-specific component